MDLLSDVVTVMRTGDPHSARVEWFAPWAQRFAPVPGTAGFQVVLEGTCWLIAPEWGAMPLSAGDVVFLPHGHGHVLADDIATPITTDACGPDDAHPARPANPPDSAGGLRTVTLCGAYRLDPARAHPLPASLPEVIHLPARRTGELWITVDQLAVELEYRRPGADAVIRGLLDMLLIHLLRAWLEDQPSGPGSGWVAALRDPSISRALNAIHRAPAAPWTVASLAAEADLSRAPFAKRFAETVGRPPLTYLTWWRMTLAARLLRDTDDTLSLIAGAVGYSSEFAFAAAFKRQFGTAPGRFRRCQERSRRV